MLYYIQSPKIEQYQSKRLRNQYGAGKTPWNHSSYCQIDAKRMGLRSSEERASLLQGKMSLESRPN